MVEDEALRGAVEALARLKAEHAPILRQIAGDADMHADTRQMLIAHLYEEEDEHVQAMLGLRERPSMTAATGEAPATGATPRLTVGSLRPDDPRRTSLGTLRPPATPFAGGPGLPPGATVGSLRL